MIARDAALAKVLFDMVDGCVFRTKRDSPISAQMRALTLYTKYTQVIMSYTDRDVIPLNDRTYIKLDYMPLTDEKDITYTFHLVLVVGYTEIGYVDSICLYDGGVVVSATVNIFEQFPTMNMKSYVNECISTLSDIYWDAYALNMPMLYPALTKGGKAVDKNGMRIITSHRSVPAKKIKTTMRDRASREMMVNAVFEKPKDDFGAPVDPDWMEYSLHGVSKPLVEWCEEADIPLDVVKNRMAHGKSLESALATKYNTYRKFVPAKDMIAGTFYFKGKEKTLREWADEYEVPVEYLEKQIKKGCTIKKAIHSAVHRYNPYPTKEELDARRKKRGI